MIKKTLLLILLFFSMAYYTMAQKNDPAYGVVVFDDELVTPGIKPQVSGEFNLFSDNRSTALVFVDEIGYQISDGTPLVERNLIGKILDEQSIGSSGLADPNQRTELGRITLGAFLVFTDFTIDEDKAIISVRAITTETGELVYSNKLLFDKNDAYNKFETEATKEGNRIYEAVSLYAKEHVINIQERQ